MTSNFGGQTGWTQLLGLGVICVIFQGHLYETVFLLSVRADSLLLSCKDTGQAPQDPHQRTWWQIGDRPGDPVLIMT